MPIEAGATTSTADRIYERLDAIMGVAFRSGDVTDDGAASNALLGISYLTPGHTHTL